MNDDRERAWGILERLSHVVREELRSVASEHGLALAQLEVLRYLARANRFSDTVSALVDFFGSTKGTLSQTASALERKALLSREPDEADGRVQHLRLTEAGAAVVRASERGSTADGFPLDDGAMDELERLLRAVLHARGGRAFGVCATCVHHRRTDDGRRCALLDLPLTDADATRICREHAHAA